MEVIRHMRFFERSTEHVIASGLFGSVRHLDNRTNSQGIEANEQWNTDIMAEKLDMYELLFISRLTRFTFHKIGFDAVMDLVYNSATFYHILSSTAPAVGTQDSLSPLEAHVVRRKSSPNLSYVDNLR